MVRIKIKNIDGLFPIKGWAIDLVDRVGGRWSHLH